MSDIRKAFVSRYPKGVMLELDFSQLEVYGLAYLSQDKVLLDDLATGKDLHAISAEMLFGKNFTDAQRKIAKMLSFQLQYGSGAKNMAETNGIPLATAKQFIENYYRRYHGVQLYHEVMISGVKMSRETSRKRTLTGKPAGVSTYVSCTGRRYTFTEKDAPDFLRNPKFGAAPVDTSFSPTQIKNYPVQGFATGDIVPLVVGKVYRALKANTYYDEQLKLVNTVHDSIVFDCADQTIAMQWAREAKAIMEDAPRFLREMFPGCADFDLDLRVEAEVGQDWHTMVKLVF